MDRRRTNRGKKYRRTNIYVIRAVFVFTYVMLISALFLPAYQRFKPEGENYYHVFLNDEEVGVLDNEKAAQECLRAARRRIAGTSPEMLYIRTDLKVEAEEVLLGDVDTKEAVIERMVPILSRYEQLALERCYTVKIGEYTLNMHSTDDVVRLLNEVLTPYDREKEYIVNLIADTTRELDVMTSQILLTTEDTRADETEKKLPAAGIQAQLSKFFDAIRPAVGRHFEDYDLGLQTISFGEKIEVTEAFMPANQISSYEDALADVSGDVARAAIYEVVYGDTLSQIAAKHGLSLDQLVEINPNLSDANSMIRPGDRLAVTRMSKKLSVVYTMQEYYEEDYYADTIYKNNDSWYINKREVVQEASPGHRRVIALRTYRDDQPQDRTIVKSETMAEAVPQIIETGTMPLPTYIWPAYGRISSGFGRRNAPKAGASTYHQGIDIAVPTGTSVMASNGGTVTVAGWQSGYGYVVYIQHGDGRVTRYGHLSRILVRTGQRVNQGERIALSGNTGNSTGPHLHFEIRINGSAVNPLNYLQ